MNKKKIILLSFLLIIIMFFCFSNNVYGEMGTYTSGSTEYEYSYTSEYEKYIGLYYRVAASTGSYEFNYSKIYNELFRSKPVVKKSELDKWITTSSLANASGGGIVKVDGLDKNDLDELCKQSIVLKEQKIFDLEQKGWSKLFLEKSIMTITDDSGKRLATIPHYIICKRINDREAGGVLLKEYEILIKTTDNTARSDVKEIERSYLSYKRSDKNSDSDFWGDASSWFGLAQGSYTPPEQINSIIDTFTDMINVVGTTVIIIATIVLGIRYIIGSVESQTAAKEGLITLLIACVFFFGWTAISNLLYGGEQMNFIFTSSTDNTYENMVGRIFATFSYIAQFIVIGAIIYVGIKYIFAGASGRAELKGKSVYFIIGIILVFATTNVLDFISKIINDAI